MSLQPQCSVKAGESHIRIHMYKVLNVAADICSCKRVLSCLNYEATYKLVPGYMGACTESGTLAKSVDVGDVCGVVWCKMSTPCP